MRRLIIAFLLVSMFMNISFRVNAVLPEFFVMGRVVNIYDNNITINVEYISTDYNWKTFSHILVGRAPNIDALNEIKIGDYVVARAFGTLAWDPNGWYSGWLMIGKMNSEKIVTDIYGDPYDISSLVQILGGYEVTYINTPEPSCNECICNAIYTDINISRNGVLLNSIRLRPGESYTYNDIGYRVEIKFYSGESSIQKCFGRQLISNFTIHIRNHAVKFRGIVREIQSQYDIFVEINEVLLDPDGALHPGCWSHIDIAGSISESDVDWPLKVGDRIEVYARHFRYLTWEYKNHTICVAVWIYPKDNPYDGYLKKISGLEAYIWVDRGCGSTYYIGNSIKIYFKVSLKAYVEIIDEFPDGSKKLLRSGWAQPNIVYYISGKMGAPDGYRIFHIYARDENGNTAHSQCYVNVIKKVTAKPDLTIISVSYNPSQPIEGDDVSFDVVVKNIGSVSANNFKIAMKLNINGEAKIDEKWIESLNPGQLTHIYFTWKAVKGSRELIFIADSQNNIDESNEQNNVKIIYMDVRENSPPIAIIDKVNPSTIIEGEFVYFKGYGYDPDGDSIVEYEWRSSIDGFLGNQKEFKTNKLSVGEHTIYFRVKDSRGKWSKPATYYLEVKKPLILSFYSEKLEIEKPYNVNFNITISNGPSGNYRGKILIYAPDNKLFSRELQIKYGGGMQRYSVEWNAPSDAVPGTYVASLILYDQSYSIVAEKICFFYLNDPDKSYIEVFKTDDNIKIIHVHLQRYRMVYENIPIDADLMMLALKFDLIGFSIRAMKNLYSIYKSAKEGVVSPTEPYDLTVFLLPKEIYGKYIGFKFETHPIKAPENFVKELLFTIFKKEILKKIIPYPSLPLPLERLAIVSKETYDSFKIKDYITLSIPVEIKIEYLTSLKSSYKLGQTMGFYVKLTDPRNNKPIENSYIRCFIGPSQIKATSISLGKIYYLGDGIYRIEIPTRYVKNIYHVNDYKIYFVCAAPGYLGVSSSIETMIMDEESFGNIENIRFSVKPTDLSFSDNLRINVNFSTTVYITGGNVYVKIRVVKKTFFGLLTKTITEKEGSIGENNIIITLKGGDIADWFLWWPIAGKYDIKIIITLTYIPYQSTVGESIEESTYPITINIHG